MILKFIKDYIFPGDVREAKRVLKENTTLVYGIFCEIKDSGYFPPRTILNEFFAQGHDPCDQDGIMKWSMFSLTDSEYEDVKNWWLKKSPNTEVNDLGVNSWGEWASKIFEEPYETSENA